MVYLQSLFEKCLEFVYFPKIWKKGKILILNKIGKNPSNAKAFRPITLLPTLGKVLEKIIKSFLEETINENSVLNDNQFAYRKSLGTEQAVIRLTEYVEKFSKDNRHALLVSFDVSGAFDKVRWSKIINNLFLNLIPYTLINYVKSFLTNRTIGHYNHGGRTIFERELFCGVPQGSILGPTLFNVVMARVHKIPYYRDLGILSYADDLLLVAGISVNAERDFKQINNAICCLNNELKSAGLAFNREKTQSLLVSKKHDKESLKREIEAKVKVEGIGVKVSPELKYLGVILDENTNFAKHVQYIKRKIWKYFNLFKALYGNKFGLSYNNRKILYQAIFTSIVSYCSAAYFPRLSQTQVNEIKTLQRKLLINVSSGYRTISYSAIYCITGELPIDQKIKLRNEIFALKRKVGSTETTELKNKIKEITSTAIQTWQSEYDNAVTGTHTKKLIPRVEHIYKNNKFQLNYYITQAITGHGNFGSYLKKFKKTESESCKGCGAVEDSVWHCIFECEKYAGLREKFNIKVEKDLIVGKKNERLTQGKREINKNRNILEYLNVLMKTKCESKC